MVLEDFLDDGLMQNIATEMNLSETVFAKQIWDNSYELRFFTPSEEVDLCGHATLSCAHILYSLWTIDTEDTIMFSSRVGDLSVSMINGKYSMSFPLWEYERIDDRKTAEDITQLQGIKTIYSTNRNWMIIELENIDMIKSQLPNFSKMKNTQYWNIAVTCKWDEKYDYYMRCFVTDCGINEDPVTGSIECILWPLWSELLWKPEMISYQASDRGWVKYITVQDDVVVISWNAITMWEIEFYI